MLGDLLPDEGMDAFVNRVLQQLNPFVNLFDEKLHTVQYVRTRSSFLFTVLMMAGCKFFKPELFKSLQKMSYVFASRFDTSPFCPSVEERKTNQIPGLGT